MILINLNDEQFLTQCTKYNAIRNNLFGPINVNDSINEFIRIIKQIDAKIYSKYILSAYELQNATLANQ